MYLLIVIVEEKPFTVGPFKDKYEAERYADQKNLKAFVDFCVTSELFESFYIDKAETYDV